ncbi:hypothetical protein D4757_15000, partial [Enterocloster bolteae]|nr:hypothetical protein [Enterocloster bolteae]
PHPTPQPKPLFTRVSNLFSPHSFPLFQRQNGPVPGKTADGPGECLGQWGGGGRFQARKPANKSQDFLAGF